MEETLHNIIFLLNDEIITLNEFDSSETLLDYLRLRKNLKGTKEGCAEGDCGACTVLIGRSEDDQTIYRSINSCVTFLASLHGTHVITIEALQSKSKMLNPVQQAIVDFHGSQCGFCTPGIVMSLYSLWLNKQNLTKESIEKTLQGNLCRCTGYGTIISAALSLNRSNVKDNKLIQEHPLNLQRLKAIDTDSTIIIESTDSPNRQKIIIPHSVNSLINILSTEKNPILISGATDVGLWVNKHQQYLETIIFISHLEELQKVTQSDECITIGSAVTYTRAEELLIKNFPALGCLLSRIGGEQIRNAGTIGGNIANGSPIGDMPPPLIALGANILLKSKQNERRLRLEDFFLDYGCQDRTSQEVLVTVQIPLLQPNDLFAVYKISKRHDEDISSLCIAIKCTVENNIIQTIIIAFGGMSAIPKRSFHTENVLVGKPFILESFQEAKNVIRKDFEPLSDLRASKEYRYLCAENLLLRFFYENSSVPFPVTIENALKLEGKLSTNPEGHAK